MNVTREVVKDLLPLYASGEASRDTRALVEAFLSHDPELARLADSIRSGEGVPAAVPAPGDAGHVALVRTKALLRRRTRLLAMALFLTGLPLSFAYDSSGFRFLLVRDAPTVTWLCWGIAFWLWLAYAWTVRRTRVTGL